MIEKIAKIESVRLGREDHGVLTMMLHVAYGGSGQGIGGFCFDSYDRDEERRKGSAFGMDWIARCLDACGVDDVFKLPGRTIYVLREDDQWDAAILGIAPLPTEPGKPFIFADLVAEHLPPTDTKGPPHAE